MPQNCNTQNFFVKSNIYTSLGSYEVQVLGKICLQLVFWTVAMVTVRISLKTFFSKNYNVICHWKDNFMLISICNRTYVQKSTVSELNANVASNFELEWPTHTNKEVVLSKLFQNKNITK